MKLDKIIAVRTGKTVYKDGGRVIKVFENGYSKADILNEALNQARIEETGLNIPKILGVTTEDGKWAIISEYISGKTLSQLMEESPELLQYVPLKHIASYLWITPQSLSRIRAKLGKKKG